MCQLGFEIRQEQLEGLASSQSYLPYTSLEDKTMAREAAV
jgi:hypothetical protein